MDLEAQDLAAARIGDRQAFGRLVERHGTLVHRFLCRRCRSAEDAQDLAQEAFIVAWTRLQAFDGRSRFTTWLLGIALNLSRDRAGKASSRHEVALDEDVERDVVDPSAGPEAQRERQRALSALQHAIERLPPDLRTTLDLVAFEDLSYDEVAALLEVPAGTVKSRVNRARMLLREAVGRQVIDAWSA